jgi:hypothetical protein
MFSGRKVSLHYEVAIHLRCYKAVICEEAHDFFHKRQIKVENIYRSIQQLTRPPYSHCVVLCGLRDPLTEVGHIAQAMGMVVEYVDLEPMACDQRYLSFVRDIAKGVRVCGKGNCISAFLPSSSAKARAIEKTTTGQPREAQIPESATASMSIDSDVAAEQTDLGASSFLSLDLCPLTECGLDVGILHAHTKGLVGNTVTVVRGLLAASMATWDSTKDEMSNSNSTPLNVAFPSPVASAVRAKKREVAQEKRDGEETKQTKQAEAAVSSIGSSDDELSHPSDAALDHPPENSEPICDDLFMWRADAQDISRGMQIQLPLAIDDDRQIEEQLEFGLVLPVALANEPIDAPYVAFGGITGKELSVDAASASPTCTCNRPSASIDPLTSGSRKRRAVFSGYLTPVHDETLGSWLSRNATSSAVAIVHDGFLGWCSALLQPTATPFALATAQDLNQLFSTKSYAALVNDAEAQTPWDPEVLLGNPRPQDDGHDTKNLECDDLYRSELFLKEFPDPTKNHMTERFRLPSNAVNQYDNRRFCAQCLADDVAAMRAPGLRRAWRNRGSALCAAHRYPVLLQQLEKGHLSTFTGGWQAYVQQTARGHFDHGVGLVSRDDSGYQTASLETRICRIVLRIQIWVEYAPGLPSRGRPSKYALYFLLGIFLYQGNLVSDGGAARWFLKASRGEKLNSNEYDKPSVAQMVKNIESASPRSLAIAYLLLGTEFNLIPEEQLCFIRRALIFADGFFPVNRIELKSLTQCFQSNHLDAIWSSALQNFPIDDLVHLAWLLRDL